jgi:hypothetical protein
MNGPLSTQVVAVPPSQPSLAYAPGRPRGLSPFIEHLGPGYVVVKLPPPPRWLELGRLGLLLVSLALFMAAIGFAQVVRPFAEEAGGVPVDDLVLMVVLLAPFVFLAAGAVLQAAVVLRRLRKPAAPAGSIMFRRPEALPEATGAHVVMRAAVRYTAFGLLRGAPAYLRVETSTGRVFELLRGHGWIALEKLEAGLRTHLLRPRPGASRASEAS